jgi:hypothetical protein
MIILCKYDIVFVQFFTLFPMHFFNNKASSWSIGFLQIVNISRLHHMLESNHSKFYVQSIQVSFPYKFLVLKMRILLFMQNGYFPLPSKFEMKAMEELNLSSICNLLLHLQCTKIMYSTIIKHLGEVVLGGMQ